ncbi:MAG TPA: transcription termination/antitermination protein NusG [Caulobacterales bacterium]|jgi:transcriptional antiterminator NusG|nr:transcription termination/antitermination protein NusG [Caulobacterales bacterium]
MNDVAELSAAPAEAAPKNPKAQWYIVHAYSNFEKKVAEAIREQAARQGLEAEFEDIRVPTEEVVEVHRNKKRVREQRHFPGYVLVKMNLTDDAYHLVKNTPKVTGFLGAQNKPQPVSEREVERILGHVQEVAAARPRRLITYEIGERVRVTDGPFASFEGVVEDVDEERGRLKVSVTIFGRATPVDLEYGQVDKRR